MGFYSYFAISAIFNFIASSIIGIVVISKNSKSNINRHFFCLSLSVAFWSIFYFLWQISDTEYWALFYSKLLMIGAIYMPITFFSFVGTFLNINKYYKIFSYIGHIVGLLFIFLFLFTPLMIKDLVPLAGFKFWPLAGPLYVIFLLFFFLYFIIPGIFLLKEFNRSIGIKKIQIKILLLGIFLAFIGGSTNYFLWYSVEILPYGNILVSIYAVLTGYAIIKYRFMDIRIAIRKFFIYFGVAALSYIVFYLAAILYIKLFGSIFSLGAYLLGLVIAPAFAFLFYLLSKYLSYIANKYFFISLYNYEETLKKLSDKLNYYTDLKTITHVLVTTIKDTMKLDRAGVLLVNGELKPAHYEIEKVIGFNRSNGISLVKDNFLTDYLRKNKQYIVKEELAILAQNAENKKEEDGLKKLEQAMNKIEASLCLPLLSGNKLNGIIVLGSKLSNEPYSKEDLELLSTLANQAGIAIDNAQLYQEVQKLNLTLQSKVDAQTKDIVNKNKKLRRLLKIKSEFLDIASHQLRTPVSVINGILSMLNEGTINKLPAKERKQFIDNAFQKGRKLNSIINDILDASDLDDENFNISKSLEETDLSETMGKITDYYQPELKQKKIKLKSEIEKNVKIMADIHYLEQAIGNLIDNALKYTDPGKSIEIALKSKNNHAIIKIKDQGIGIPEKEQKNIFKKFSRASNAKELYTDGSGLGLFIVKKIVTAHPEGKIWFKSKEGEGTSFYIRLPLK